MRGTTRLASLVLGWAAAAGAQQGSPQFLSGTVVGRSGSPLSGVRVVGVLRGVIRSEAVTDASGAFRLRWWRDSLPMTVAFRRIGVVPRQREIVRWPSRSDTLHVTLEDRLAELERVLVRARPSRPVQEIGSGVLGPGAVARGLDVSSGLSGDLAGDPAAALQWVPGVTVPPGGGLSRVSVFGLGGEDNARTLNGQQSYGGPLPRDGLTQSVRLSTYDPRLGRFAGAVLTSVLPSGNFIQRAAGRLSFQPGGDLRDARTPAVVGGAPMDLIASGTLAGPLTADRTFYSLSGQVQRRTTRVATLAAAGSPTTGADSLTRLRRTADSLGLGARDGGATQVQQATVRSSAVARIDLTPNAQASGNPQATVLYVLLTGTTDQQRNEGVGRFSTPAAATTATRADGSVQTVWAPYLSAALLEIRTRVATGAQRTRPERPSPKVLVSPVLFADGLRAAASLGGSGEPPVRDAYRAWETTVDLAWRNVSGSHAYNAFLQTELGSRTLTAGTVGGGVLTYPSLAAFQQNRPGRFVGAASDPSVLGRSAHLAAAFSDAWTPSASGRNPFAVRAAGLAVQFGLRGEVDLTQVAPATPPASGLPDTPSLRLTRGALLPMVGATWRTGEVARRVEGFPTTFFRHELQAGARRYRGGMGVLGVTSLPFAAGLGRWRTREECVGEAVVPPTPTEPEGAGVGCVLVAEPMPRAGAQVMQTLEPSWRPPESLRGEVRWTRRQSAALSSEVTLTVAANSHQAMLRERNLRPEPVASDAREGGRFRYFAPADVDPGSGTLVGLGRPIDPRVARSIEVVSRGASRVGQMTLGVTWRPGATGTARLDPVRPIEGHLRAAYTATWGTVRGTAYSLGVTGDPDAGVQGRLGSPVHAVLLTGRLSVRSWFTLQSGLRLTSGTPFTPTYASDVNGDGAANDRVFVPAGEAGQTFLAALGPEARRCLARFSGAFATVNGCTTRWALGTAPLIVELDPRRFRLGSRASATLVVANPLTGLDRLLHGERPRGWGAPAVVDPALVSVTGYDRERGQFRYGAGAGVERRGRALLQPPVSVTLDVRVDLSRNLETQRIETFVRRGDGGQPLAPSQFHARLLQEAAAFGAEDIGFIVQALDSLDCDSLQRERLQGLARQRREERSATLAGLAARLADGLTDLRGRALRDAWHNAMIASLESSERITREALQVLTPGQVGWLLQRELLPSFQRPPGWLDRERRLPQLTVR